MNPLNFSNWKSWKKGIVGLLILSMISMVNAGFADQSMSGTGLFLYMLLLLIPLIFGLIAAINIIGFILAKLTPKWKYRFAIAYAFCFVIALFTITLTTTQNYNYYPPLLHIQNWVVLLGVILIPIALILFCSWLYDKFYYKIFEKLGHGVIIGISLGIVINFLIYVLGVLSSGASIGGDSGWIGGAIAIFYLWLLTNFLNILSLNLNNILLCILIGAILGFLYDKFRYRFNLNFDWKYPAGAAIFLLAAFIVFPSMLQNFSELNPFTINPSCPVARPYFGSINCEKYQEVQYNAFGGQQFNVGPTYGIYDARAASMQKVSSTGSCAWGDMVHLDLIDYDTTFGTSTRAEICTTQQDTFNQNVCNQGALSKSILNGHTYTLDVYCRGVLGNQYAHPSPSDFIITYQYTNEVYYIHFDSAVVPLSGTIGCKSQQLYNDYYTKYNQDMAKNQLGSSALATVTNSVSSGVMGAINWIGGLGSSSVPTGSFINDVPQDAKAGDGFLIITDWKQALPGLSTQNYNGQEVYCDQYGGFGNHRLIAFNTIQTGFAGQGYCYTIPTTVVATGVQCCNSGECQAYYSDSSYNCDTKTFTCQKSISCYSDLNCGTQQYCSFQNGKYTLSSGACVNGQCTTSNQDVKCCPSGTSGASCPAGTYCKADEGCKAEIQQCPAGACCTTGEEYIYQTCGADKPVCCPTTNKNLGWCKATQNECNCVNGNCGTCAFWDVPCMLRGMFSGLFNFAFPSVSFDVGIMGGLVGALIFGAIGLLGGPVIAIIAAIVGFIVGSTLAGLLENLKIFIALVAAALGSNYMYDLLKEKFYDKIQRDDIRWLVAILCGLIFGFAVFVNYWYGIILALLYVAAKLIWMFIPYGRPTQLVGKSKWLYNKIKK